MPAGRKPFNIHEEEVTGKILDWALYRRLLPFGRPYWLRFASSIGLLLIVAAGMTAAPLLIRQAIDTSITNINHLPMPERLSSLGWLALITVGVGLLTTGARYAQLILTNRTGQRIIYDVRRHVFDHIGKRSLRFFDTNPVGKLVTRVTSDVEALAELFSSGIDVIFYDLLMIFLILGVLFFISPALALWTLIILPFVLVWSFYFKHEAQTLFRNVRSKVSQLNSYINESVTGIRVIQMFCTEQRVQDRFRDFNDELRESHVRTVRNFSLFFPGIETLSTLGVSIILLAGHSMVADESLTIGDMMAFWFLLQRFFEPLRQISEKYNVLQSAMASSERIFKILDDHAEIPNPVDPVALKRSSEPGAVCFDGVTFSYDGANQVLHDISFEVQAGERTAIVGATGSGKTSIINVLARFYDVEAGRVLVNGHDITTLDKHDLRRHVGVVLQDVFLFADTVRENLRLGNESVSDDTLWQALERVSADSFIRRLPDGLDHIVAERGSMFSTGEKQLLAFARTLVHDPPILVLDEATANIDTETELRIQKALETLMANRTVLVIAHRLSTIRSAGQIIVMHHGVVHETGTHEELLQHDGLYRKLYELQYTE